MKATNQTDIIEALANITGEKTIRITTKTEVKLLKKSEDGAKNELGTIYKTAVSDVVVGRSYTAAVNEAREVEGKATDFQAAARKWGTNDGVMITRGEDKYLSAILLKQLSSSYSNSDGVAMTSAQLAPFFSKSKPHAARQGVENEVQVRSFKVSSITELDLLS